VDAAGAVERRLSLGVGAEARAASLYTDHNALLRLHIYYH